MLPLTVSRLRLVDGHVESEPAGPLLDVVCALLRAPDPVGVVLLGGFGSGKTTLCRKLTELDDGRNRPSTYVPLAVLARVGAVDEGLKRTVGEARLSEARDGRRVLLLDGLDEVPDAAAGGTPGLFDALTHAVGPRWLLTSRPGHVRTDDACDPDQADSLMRDDVVTLLIDPLDRDTVKRELGQLPNGDVLLTTVDGLEDLTASPLLLQIATAALRHIQPGRPIDAWGVFDAWLRHALRTGPDHDDALQRLEDLAVEAWQESGWSPEATSFRADQLAAARLPAELRRTLVVTELDGRIRFGHRSVFEYLLASHIAPRLLANQGHGPDALTGRRITDATRAFLVGRVGRMPLRFAGDRVRVPRGNFVAGGTVASDERRLRIEHVAEPAWIGRAPVTGREWSRFLTAAPDDRADANYLPHWGSERRLPPGDEELPIYGVWPEDADRYAAWAGGRLPSADLWEKAVRGLDGRRWPWGDHWRGGLAATAELGLRRPMPVRALGASGDTALFSSIGNVFEYTSTPWRGRMDRGRVVMGGCYAHPAATARPSLRLSHRLSGNLKAGLRVAWDDV